MHQLTFDDLAAARSPDAVEMWRPDPWHPEGGTWAEVEVTERHRYGIVGWYLHRWRNSSEWRRARLNYMDRGSVWRERS